MTWNRRRLISRLISTHLLQRHIRRITIPTVTKDLLSSKEKTLLTWRDAFELLDHLGNFRCFSVAVKAVDSTILAGECSNDDFHGFCCTSFKFDNGFSGVLCESTSTVSMLSRTTVGDVRWATGLLLFGDYCAVRRLPFPVVRRVMLWCPRMYGSLLFGRQWWLFSKNASFKSGSEKLWPPESQLPN